MKQVLALVMGWSLAFASVAYGGPAYTEVSVKNGGTLSGVVQMSGGLPPARNFPVAMFPFGPFCTKNGHIYDGEASFQLGEFAVSDSGALTNTVILVEDVRKGKPFDMAIPEVAARDCEFVPFVNVVRNEHPLRVVNEDPVLHNSQIYQAEKGNVILNVPMAPQSDITYTLKFQRNKRIYQMICGMHEFMQTWGIAVDNPYYTVVADDGTFTIDDIPPGTYTVTAWHPHIPTIEQKVKIPASGHVTTSFTFEAEDVQRANYETQKQFRIGR